jgi:hypothetical protein
MEAGAPGVALLELSGAPVSRPIPDTPKSSTSDLRLIALAILRAVWQLQSQDELNLADPWI